MNRARDAVINWLDGREDLADQMLAFLWIAGYKVTPLTKKDLRKIREDIDDEYAKQASLPALLR